MKKLALTSALAVALAISVNSAVAADYESQIQQLVVSGIVESWTGVTIVTSAGGDVDPDQDEFLASGQSGRLSLPLGDNLSIQGDVDFEYGSTALASEDSDDNFEYAMQFGTHLSWRDPNRGLFGVFGGFGGARSDTNADAEFWFAGGEAQFYTQDMTFYLQAGYMDSDDDVPGNGDDAFRDAAFVRGVARWFVDPDTRLQLEAAYADGVTDDDDSNDTQIYEWGVRFDTVLMGLPVIGDTAVFVGYRGNHYEGGDGGNDQYSEHTFMVGSSYHFGGTTRKEFERTGAGLDLPNFGRWSASGENID
jgi:hypothetical protein